MYLCFEYNIYLLFLLPYTLHVLQPLDLAVFSSLKRAYRKKLSNLSLLTDSIPIGKQNFLFCYQQARKEALVPQNIKARQKATRLQPLNIAKPLISRLLLENNNNTEPITIKDLIKEARLVQSKNILLVYQETPKRAKDLCTQAEAIT